MHCKNKTARLLLSLTLSTLSLSTFSLSTMASNLSIKNENNKAVDVVIQSIVAPSDKATSKEMTIPANKTISIALTKDDLGGKETYFVKGKTNSLTPKGECDDMKVDQDYNVTFTKNLTVGTGCHCEQKTKA